jgi:acyl-CoA synthetase (AMP-forming)/AMP-acid ligase II
MNATNVFSAAALHSANKIALSDLDASTGRHELSYQALNDQILTLSGALLTAGLKSGERVAMLIGNGWEYVVCFHGILAAGMVAVPMNVRLLEPELAHILSDSGARLLIAQHDLLNACESLNSVTELGVWMVRGPVSSQPSLIQKLRESIPLQQPVYVTEETLASIMYTSGTTGRPKGVMLSHGAWSAVSTFAVRELGYGDDEVTVHTAALTHGSGYLVLPTVAVGGKNVICAKFDARRILDLLGTERITGGFFVPSMIRMLLDASSDTPVRAPYLRCLYYAGSPIDVSTLQEAMQKFGPVLVQSFAQTEIPMFLTVMSRTDHVQATSGMAPELLRAAGRPIDGMQVRIVDDSGEDAPPGEPGEIIAKGPNMMLGYWANPEATAQTIVDDWLYTGDIGSLDKNGVLYIVDRKKDMIISGGSNVYAREVEEVLLRHPCVKDVAVIGLPHIKWGEMVTAVLVRRENRSADDLDDYCRNNIPDFRRPKRMVWVDELPRNSYGKVLKRQLKTELEEPAR